MMNPIPSGQVRPLEDLTDLSISDSFKPKLSEVLINTIIAIGATIFVTFGFVLVIYAVILVVKRFIGMNSSEVAQYGRDLTKAASNGEFKNLVLTERDQNNLEKITKCLKSAENSNLLIVGPQGSGKETAIHFLAIQISEKSSDPSLQNREIIEIDTNDIIGGATLIGEYEGRVRDFFKLIEKEKAILYIPSFDSIQTKRDISNSSRISESIQEILLPFLKRKAFSCIIRAQNNRSIADTAFQREFETINVSLRTVIEKIEVIEKTMNLSSILKDNALDIFLDIQKFIPYQGSLHTTIKVFKKINKNLENPTDASNLNRALEKVTRIPLFTKSNQWLLSLGQRLKSEILGQETAIQAISRSVITYFMGMKIYKRPIGVYLLVGPTGTGKTQTALSVAEIAFQGHLIRLDMQYFKLGFDTAQIKKELSEKLLLNPFSVVLLDEIDKAHTEILHFFLSIFDEGYFINDQGILVDCRQALFLMTSNKGSSQILDESRLLEGQEKTKSTAFIADSTQNFIEQIYRDSFSHELIGRLDDILLFRPLNEVSILALIIKELEALKKEWAKYPHLFNLIWDEKTINYLFTQYKREQGARSIIDALKTVRDEVSQLKLKGIILKDLSLSLTVEMDTLKVNIN